MTKTRICLGHDRDLDALIDTHVFQLVPNNSGSSLLKTLLASGKRSWINRREGQYMLGYQGLIPSREGVGGVWNAFPEWRARYRAQDPAHWPLTRKAWYFQARSRAPDAHVFVEKSPPFLVIADQLVTHFRNVRFLITTRDPYAVAEGILRKKSTEAMVPDHRSLLQIAADHLVQCFLDQQYNLAMHAERSLFLSYEAFCADPHAAIARIGEWLPALDDLHVRESYEIKQRYSQAITNLNPVQIDRLTRAEMDELTARFAPHEALFAQFGYRLR